MKKYILMLCVLLPAMLWGDKYVGKGWWYIEPIGGMLGVPAYRGELLNLNIGINDIGKGVPGVAIGTSLFDVVGFYRQGLNTGGFLPGYIRLLVPLSDIRYSSAGDYYFPSVLHFFSSVCPWFDMPWIVVGGGVDWTFEIFTIGIETGFLNIESKRSFYAGVKLQVGRWHTLGTSKTVPEIARKPKSIPKYEKVSREKPSVSQSSHPRYPPDLGISNIRFSEPSGNNLLDAQENGKISFVITNQGKGKAVGVEVKTFSLQGGKGIVFNKLLDVGNILPNTSKTIRVSLKGTKNTTDGTTKLRIETIEHFGFDADPFTISFGTQRLIMPKLIIADVGIDDDKEGESYGDNDGIIERGEAIEVSAGIQNAGEGDAENTQVSLTLPQEGENLFYNSDSHSFTLGKIPSGDYKIVKFCFMTNKRFSAPKIPVLFDIKSTTGDYVKRDSISLPVGSPSRYTKEITIAKREVQKAHRQRRVGLSVDVDNVPKIAKSENPNAIAVIIGIEEYRYAPPATYANRDAVIFYEYTKKVLGIPEKNIYIRTNEDATKGEFDKVFGRDGWIARRVEKGKSDVYIYFSGHGAPDIKTHKPYIIPYDIDPNYASSAFPIQELYSSVSRLGAKSVNIFLDACFSGEARSEKMLLASARPFSVVPISQGVPAGLNVFTASSGAQIASAYNEEKHGLFTYFLLKGLRGKGDLNRDGKITAGELYRYIKTNVETKARDMDREQTPTFKGHREEIITTAVSR